MEPFSPMHRAHTKDDLPVPAWGAGNIYSDAR